MTDVSSTAEDGDVDASSDAETVDAPNYGETDITAEAVTMDLLEEIKSNPKITAVLDRVFGWEIRRVMDCRCNEISQGFYSFLIVQTRENAVPLNADALAGEAAKSKVSREQQQLVDDGVIDMRQRQLAKLHSESAAILQNRNAVDMGNPPAIALTAYKDPDKGAESGRRFFGLLSLNANSCGKVILCERLFLHNGNRNDGVFFGTYVLEDNGTFSLVEHRVVIVKESESAPKLMPALDRLHERIEANTRWAAIANWTSAIGLAIILLTVLASLVLPDLEFVSPDALVFWAVLLVSIIVLAASDGFVHAERIWRAEAIGTLNAGRTKLRL